MIRVALITALVVVAAGCDLGSLLGGPGGGTDDLGSSGTIDTDTVLSPTGNSPDYTVSGDLSVEAQLTIEPGVEIAFAEDALLAITTSGVLVAEGTAADPIVLTSTDPSAGIRWSGVRIESSSTKNALTHVTVESAGGDNEHYLSGWRNAGVSVYENALLTMENTTISNSGDWGLYAEGTLAAFSTNTFSGNTGGAASVHPNDWGVIDADSTFTGNGYNGIMIDALFPLSEDQTVTPLANGAPYQVDGHLSVAAGLTIGAGTQIEMDARNLYGQGYGMITVETSGYLTAEGTSTAPIVFTSSDVVGGQLWNGILFESASNNNVLDYTHIRYAGRENEHYHSGWRKVAVSVDAAARLSLTNSVISHSGDWGFYDHGELTAFAANDFSNNQGPAASIHPNYWGIVAGSSTFSGNGYDGIVIDAQFDLTTAQSVAALPSDAPYLVDGDLNVNAGLTVADGSRLEFDATGVHGSGFGQLRVSTSGFLNADATTSDGIVFTSNDVAGGQHWNGITIDSSSGSNVLDNVVVSYGGRENEHYVSGWEHANIAVTEDGVLALTNSTISYAQATGTDAYGLVVHSTGSINGVTGSSATSTDVNTNTFEVNDVDHLFKN